MWHPGFLQVHMRIRHTATQVSDDQSITLTASSHTRARVCPQAMLDAGAFEDVTALIREPGLGAALTDECLYVLANPLTPHVAADFAVTKALVKSGLVQVLTGMLANSASLPTPTVLLLLNGINVSSECWAEQVA